MPDGTQIYRRFEPEVPYGQRLAVTVIRPDGPTVIAGCTNASRAPAVGITGEIPLTMEQLVTIGTDTRLILR